MANDKIIACICEGSAESAIVNKLMDAGKLIFTRDDLLDNEVLRCRSAKLKEDYHMDNKEKLNKLENNEEFIIPEFEDYQSKKKPDVDEVIKKLNEKITALEAEENTFEEIKRILEKHNFKYLCDPDLNAVEIIFDERPFRVQIILNEYTEKVLIR